METKNIIFFNKLHLSCIFILILLLNPFLLFAELASSLQDLVETPKDEEAEGIANLKRYLSNLGYIHESNSATTHHNNDLFDDKLEEALKKYQAFFGLQVTGGLDLETVKKLSIPRCGVRDILLMNRSSSSQLINNQTSISASLYAFINGRPKWSSTNLTYSYDVGTHTEAKQAIDDAFHFWANATELFTFTYTTEYKVANITISFQKGDHGDGAPFNGPARILAHSAAPPFGMIHLNAEEAWTNGAENGKIDLLTVVLHEIGHALGLAHSSYHDALMYPIINIGKRKPLGQDDIDGMKALYN